MKKRIVIFIFSLSCIFKLIAQDTTSQKQRLDFAKNYFELGGIYFPSFTGKRLLNGQETMFTHPASMNQYIAWGGFHFWGHAEFYVNIPLKHRTFSKNEETDFELLHNVITGARFYPWAIKEKKIRPYFGIGWSSMSFKQTIEPEQDQPYQSKNFMLNYEAGFTYNFKNFGVRLGANYFNDNTWKYPISPTQKSTIKTPNYSFQLGLLYAFDMTKNNPKNVVDEWNSYPKKSKLSYNAKKFGDFFIAAGPSSSFSLSKSKFNQSNFPFLKDRLSSKPYFDYAIGYQFNKANFFTALSYRNPEFETKGYGVTQNIKKNSIAFEVNKYLSDYRGHASYIGFNIAYDNIKYTEDVNGVKRELSFSSFEPGITFGWDIVPGKTSEAITLRTNLRWYPLSNFGVDGQKFKFSQLEYNLIQVVFYPERLKKRK